MALPTSTTTDQFNKDNIKAKPKLKPIYILLGFILISAFIAFVIGGIILGKDKNQKSISEDELTQIDAKSIPDNPNEWKSYELPTIGMEIKLPEKLSIDGSWNEQIKPGEKGSLICFSNEAGGKSVCSGKVLIAGGSSIDYQEGRGGTFTDLQGFASENGKIFIKSTGGNKFELTNSKYKEMSNSNGVQVIKILGEPEGLLEDGYLGAIANTKNAKYPGFAIQLKLDEGVSEYEFDQVIESLKFKD